MIFEGTTVSAVVRCGVRLRWWGGALAGVAVAVGGFGADVAAVAAPLPPTPAASAGTIPGEAVGTVGRPLRIMPLGDSITVGVGSRTRSSYRKDLFRRLTGAGVVVDYVGSQHSGDGADPDHEGHGGWTIARIAGRVGGWLATYQPDVVLVHLGTNNVSSGEPPAEIAAELSGLVDRIRAARPQARVLVSQIVGSKSPAESARGRDYNAWVARLMSAKGPLVEVVDQSTIDGIDLLDLHHPNDFGYAKMSWNFFRALENDLAGAGRSWSLGVNPYQLTSSFRCLWRPVRRDGRRKNLVECRRWMLRVVNRQVDGADTPVRRWQTLRTVTETYRVEVGGREVSRTRRVSRWFGAEPFLQVTASPPARLRRPSAARSD